MVEALLRALAPALGAAALCLGIVPASAQTALQPVPEVDLWFGCPSGQVMKTAPDPRPGAAQRPVVRCTARSLPVAPTCPRGMAVTIARGADACVPAPGAPAGSTDGTSNTVQFGEQGSGTSVTMADGSVRTVNSSVRTGGSQSPGAPPVPQPRCLAPAMLFVDFDGTADSCLIVTISAPAERVRIAAPQ